MENNQIKIREEMRSVGFISRLRRKRWFRWSARLLIVLVSLPWYGDVFGLTTGPSQPEYSGFQGFQPGENVDPFSGDFTYSIELGDVDGVFPLTLSYSSESVTWDAEASWVGLGWNLNVGALQRSVNGLPDDARGDILEEQQVRKNQVRAGLNIGIKKEFWGGISDTEQIRFTILYDNYEGISLSSGLSISNFTIGFQSGVGPSFSYSYSFSSYIEKENDKIKKQYSSSLGISLSPGSYAFSVNSSWKGDFKGKYRELKSGSTLFSKGQYILGSSKFPSWSMGVNISLAPGTEIFGVEGLALIGGSFFYRHFHKDPIQFKSYGYLYLEEGIGKEKTRLDFMYDGPEGYTPGNPTIAPVYLTPDMYSASAFGLSLQFRPQRRNVGFVHPQLLHSDESGEGDDGGEGKKILKKFLDFLFGKETVDNNIGISIEVGGGNTLKLGFDVSYSYSNSNTGIWKNAMKKLPRFKKNDVFWKVINGGGLINPYNFSLYGIVNVPYYVALSGNSIVHPGSFPPYYTHELAQPYSIQAYTVGQCEDYFGTVFPPQAKPDHIGRFDIISPEGRRYIFDKPLYQWTKQVTFRIEHNDRNGEPRVITYDSQDASPDNNRGKDNLFTYQKHPAYAYAYLPTKILGPYYSDRNGNGPDTADLGWWAKLSYTDTIPYTWRDPVGTNKANYSPGEYFRSNDGTGSYTFGYKQVAYLTEIETPYTRVEFVLGDRNDALGVNEDGSVNPSMKLKKLKKIVFYRRGEGGQWFKYREVHFKYDSMLAQNTPNSNAYGKGRLTLRKVKIVDFDIYGGFQTGVKEYSFEYWYENFKYKNEPTAFVDRWGIYTEGLTWRSRYATQDTTKRNKYVSIWKLKRITDPYGLVMEVEYESDRYLYVQNKRAYRMYRITEYAKDKDTAILTVDIGQPITPEVEQQLFEQIQRDNNLVYVRIPVNLLNDPPRKKNFSFIEVFGKYVKHKVISGNRIKIWLTNPVEALLSKSTNPIQLAAINYDMHNATDQAYPGLADFLNSLISPDGSVPSLTGLFTTLESMIAQLVGGARGVMMMLRKNGVGSAMLSGSPDAVIRLGNIGERLGGTARVRKIKYYSIFEGDTVSHVLRYKYGPGVASFEPAYNHEENPFALPAFYKSNKNNPVSSFMAWAGLISDPVYFQLGPVMRSAFPGASIGYEWVEVEHVTPQGVLSTGTTRYEYYTYKDFPVHELYSPINAGTASMNPSYIQTKISIGHFLSPYKYKMDYVAASQGHVAVTHNMHGKLKRKIIYDGSGRVIRREIYHYKPGSDGTLFVKPDGHLDTLYSGVDMDFLFHIAKYNRTNMSMSVQINMGGVILWPLPPAPVVVPLGLAGFNLSEFKGRTITATKRIYIHYFLEKTEIWDRTQHGYQKSYAYDLTTGEPLVQEVSTSLSSPPVYTVKVPAYWQYERMASAHTLEGMVYEISTNGNGQITAHRHIKTSDPWYRQSAPLIPGDVLINLSTKEKVWVIKDEVNGGLFLIDSVGNPIANLSGNWFMRIRSGNKNIFGVSVAEVQSLSNPLKNGRLELTNNDSILSASLTTFSDRWQLPCTKQCSLAQGAIETVVLGGLGNPVGNAIRKHLQNRILNVVEGSVSDTQWLSNVLEYKGANNPLIPDTNAYSIDAHPKYGYVYASFKRNNRYIGIGVKSQKPAYYLKLHDERYSFQDVRIRSFGEDIYLITLIRQKGQYPAYRTGGSQSVVIPKVDAIYLTIFRIDLNSFNYQLVANYLVGSIPDYRIINVRINNPGVIVYALENLHYNRHIVGALQVSGHHLIARIVKNKVKDVLWNNGNLIFTHIDTKNKLVFKDIVETTVIKGYKLVCGEEMYFNLYIDTNISVQIVKICDTTYIYEKGNNKIDTIFKINCNYKAVYDTIYIVHYDTTVIIPRGEPYLGKSALFSWKRGKWQVLVLNKIGSNLYQAPLRDTTRIDNWQINADDLLPVTGKALTTFALLDRDSDFVFLSLDTTTPCYRTDYCYAAWKLDKIEVNYKEALTTASLTLPIKDSVQRRFNYPGGYVASHSAGCSCPDSAIVRIEHPKACCTGKITVLNNTPIKVWRYVSGSRELVGSDTYFEGLCPGLYLIEPANPSHPGCRWRQHIALDASMLCTGPNAGTVNPYVKGLRGRWMVHRQYVWRGSRTPYDTSRTRMPHLRYEGTYHNWSSFFDYSSGKLKINPSGQGWYEASRVTQMGLWGEPVEEVNMLGITSAALFGYQRHLPVLVGSYTRLRNMFFTSFEEMEVLRSHVRLPDYYLDTLENRLTTQLAHTGYHSLYVPARDSFSIYGTTVRRTCNTIYEPRSVPFRVSGCDCMDPFSPEPGTYYYYAWVKWPTKVKWDTICKPGFCIPINFGGGMSSVSINKDSMSALRMPSGNQDFPMSTIKPKCYCERRDNGGFLNMYKCCPVKRLIPIDPQLRLTVWWRGGSAPNQPPEYVSPPIDGWRLYRWKVRFPDECGKFGFKLTSGNSWHFWIDDIRLEPADSRSEAYVYDPAILRPVAKFGPPHGATMYRYDERGQLVTVLQEVERGLFGISHQRQNWNAK